MLGHKERIFESIDALTLDDLVPADHFYRHVERTLDLSFVRGLVRDCYAAGGRPSVDPVVFFKLQLVMFFEGLRSERQLLAHAADRLSVRWYLGYDLDEPLPDHSSLTRICDRYGLDIFQRFFERVVTLCQQAGLIWGVELFIDATKVRANADVDSLVPRWYDRAKAHVDELFTATPDADASGPSATEMTGSEPPAPPVAEPACCCSDLDHDTLISLPVSAPADVTAQLAAANQATWKLLEEHKLDPTRPAGHGYQRTSDRSVSTTDSDAVPMRHRTGDRVTLGYHDHYVVDGGKARIIVAALVTPADVMENQAMLDLVWRARFRWRVHPQQVVGDTTYGTIENIRALEDAGIHAYVPLPDLDRSPYYGPSRFTYDPERDAYRCPQGYPLARGWVRASEEAVIYRADAATCNACPVKAACTASDQGRTVHRSFYATYIDRVRGYQTTAAYQKALRKRKVWVEPLFGEAKDWHGLRRFRLRGLDKVNSEGLLVAAGQNLKRLLSRSGWGHRPWPCGAAGLRLAPAFYNLS